MKQQITIGGKTITIKFAEFEDEIDVDRLLQINWQRLSAEAVSFPAILNKLGMMMVEAENELKEANLDLEIFIAKQREKIRSELNEIKRTESLSQDDIRYTQESMLKSNPGYLARSKKVLSKQKVFDYIKSLYWSAKDKSDKINLFLSKLHLEDIQYDLEKIAGKINGVTVKMFD